MRRTPRARRRAGTAPARLRRRAGPAESAHVRHPVLHGVLDRSHVLRVLDALHVPAVRLHARAVILAVEGDRGRAIDRDVVFVVADDQLAEAEMTRYRGGLLADALHQITV